MSLPVTTKTNAQNIFRAYADKIKNMENKVITAEEELYDPTNQENSKTALYIGDGMSIDSSFIYTAYEDRDSVYKYWSYTEEAVLYPEEIPNFEDAEPGKIYAVTDASDEWHAYVKDFDTVSMRDITEEEHITFCNWLPPINDAIIHTPYILPDVDRLEPIYGEMYTAWDGQWYPTKEDEDTGIEVIRHFSDELPEETKTVFYAGTHWNDKTPEKIPMYYDKIYYLGANTSRGARWDWYNAKTFDNIPTIEQLDDGEYARLYAFGTPNEGKVYRRDGDSIIEVPVVHRNFSFPDTHDVGPDDLYVFDEAWRFPDGLVSQSFYTFLTSDGGTWHRSESQPEFQFEYLPDINDNEMRAIHPGIIVQYTGPTEYGFRTGCFYRLSESTEYASGLYWEELDLGSSSVFDVHVVVAEDSGGGKKGVKSSKANYTVVESIEDVYNAIESGKVVRLYFDDEECYFNLSSFSQLHYYAFEGTITDDDRIRSFRVSLFGGKGGWDDVEVVETDIQSESSDPPKGVIELDHLPRAYDYLHDFNGQYGDVVRLSKDCVQSGSILKTPDTVYYVEAGSNLWKQGRYRGRFSGHLPTGDDYEEGDVVLFSISGKSPGPFIFLNGSWGDHGHQVYSNYLLSDRWPYIDSHYGDYISASTTYVIFPDTVIGVRDPSVAEGFIPNTYPYDAFADGQFESLYFGPGCEFMIINYYDEAKSEYRPRWVQMTVPAACVKPFSFQGREYTTVEDAVKAIAKYIDESSQAL